MNITSVASTPVQRSISSKRLINYLQVKKGLQSSEIPAVIVDGLDAGSKLPNKFLRSLSKQLDATQVLDPDGLKSLLISVDPKKAVVVAKRAFKSTFH